MSAASAGARWAWRNPQLFVSAALMVVGAFAVWGFAIRSEAFRVTDVQLPSNSGLSVPASVRGQNLWTVDVGALARQLGAQRPELKQVRVVRVVPNALRIEATERVPAAQVQAGQWHAIDRDGYVFSEASATPLAQLVILKGVTGSGQTLKAGREHALPKLALALRVLERLQRAPALRGERPLTRVDVSDPRQLTFLLDEDVEIRCGAEEELDAQLERLRFVLQRLARQSLPIRYIDVRFDDPVIGPKAS